MSLWSNNKLIGADNMFVLQASPASLLEEEEEEGSLSESDSLRGGVVALIHSK